VCHGNRGVAGTRNKERGTVTCSMGVSAVTAFGLYPPTQLLYVSRLSSLASEVGAVTCTPTNTVQGPIDWNEKSVGILTLRACSVLST
jgi:hypothetical protein